MLKPILKNKSKFALKIKHNIKYTNKKKIQQTELKKKRLKRKKLYKMNIVRNSLQGNQYLIQNPTFLITPQKRINFQLNIRITPNNVFCTLKDLIKNKILIIKSAGLMKLKVSKKTLKFAHRLIIKNFIDSIHIFLKQVKTKKNIGPKLLLSIRGPLKLRTRIINQFLILLKRNRIIIRVLSLKCFNGCRPKKQKRKKQKGLRVFK